MTFTLDRKISSLDKYVGKSGLFFARRLWVQSIREEEHVILAAVDSDDNALDAEETKWLFELPATVEKTEELHVFTDSPINKLYEEKKSEILGSIAEKDGEFLAAESEKLDRWAEDRYGSLEAKLKEFAPFPKILANFLFVHAFDFVINPVLDFLLHLHDAETLDHVGFLQFIFQHWSPHREFGCRSGGRRLFLCVVGFTATFLLHQRQPKFLVLLIIPSEHFRHFSIDFLRCELRGKKRTVKCGRHIKNLLLENVPDKRWWT